MTLRTDLHVQQGVDCVVDLPTVDRHGRPRTLVGWTAKAAIRHSPDTPIEHEPAVTVRPGSVRISIPGSVSAGWGWRRSSYQVVLCGPQGERERHAAGRVLVDPSLIED